MRVMVVEDERRMALHIARALGKNAFAVDLAHDGERALDLARASEYDMIILDIMLPKFDGLSVCRQLRQSGKQVPVLMLSACGMVEDRVRGLEAGADDYLVKPFAMQELLARMHALIRRQSRDTLAVLKVGDVEMNLATRRVRRNGREIALTQKEYELLEYLLRRPTVVHTRAAIAEHVWTSTADESSNVVDVYVKRLRDKIDLEQHPDERSFILSVRGVGYLLRDSVGDSGVPAIDR